MHCAVEGKDEAAVVALVAAKAAVDLQVCTHIHILTLCLCAPHTHTQSRRPPSLMDTPPWGYGAGSALFREGSAGGGGGVASSHHWQPDRPPTHRAAVARTCSRQENGVHQATPSPTSTPHIGHTPYHPYSVPIDGTKINVMRTQRGWYTTAPPTLLSPYYTTKTSGYTTPPLPPPL